ncbi:hypothetical protein B0I72DRAFT_37180 [Yarrowia lipolytica]|uniref:Uncharacterized protein n=1 Tax=Yarrowia lipolytica TaxID=4952 RepID=A0A371BZT7_YARLL|nr:hypothetical protein B0I71DRAFT_12264 [Yarrowia lipolytica]RDW32492.1 hypothetical protein B0I72DRAFT_37180 [Yarrowia lipolytica]RDW36835.1 hypothetical protein B0I73DRAFT_14480 [Yarrowia lipolytica]
MPSQQLLQLPVLFPRTIAGVAATKSQYSTSISTSTCSVCLSTSVSVSVCLSVCLNSSPSETVACLTHRSRQTAKLPKPPKSPKRQTTSLARHQKKKPRHVPSRRPRLSPKNLHVTCQTLVCFES